MESEKTETENVCSDQPSHDENSGLGFEIGNRRPLWIKLAWISFSLMFGFIFIPSLLLAILHGIENLTNPSSSEFDSLVRGMSREQVRAILGDPSFVESDGSWDYGQGWNDGVVIEFDTDGRYSSISRY